MPDNPFVSAQTATLIRSVLKIAGTWMLAQSGMDAEPDDVEAMVGGAMVLGGIAWSAVCHRVERAPPK